MSKSSPLLSWGLLLLLALIWGSSFILIKTGLKGLSAGDVGALRILSASVFLIPMALKSLRHLTRKHWGLLFTIGLCGSLIPSFLFAVAQTSLPSSVAGILNALTPMFTMVLGVLFFHQSLSRRTFLGLLLGLAGTAYLILADGNGGLEGINLYALLVIMATVFYGANLNIIKFKIQDLNARTITSVSLLIVGPFAAFYLFVISDFASSITMENATPIGAILLLGVLGTAIALVLFNELVKITNPVFTSSVTYIIPIVAVGWGLVDGEKLATHHVIGMTMIITGVYLANKKRTVARQSVKG